VPSLSASVHHAADCEPFAEPLPEFMQGCGRFCP
jgi:hypothetical protein